MLLKHKVFMEYSRVRNRLQYGRLNEFYFLTHILCALTPYGYLSLDLHSPKSCSGCHVGFCLELAHVGRGASIESSNTHGAAGEVAGTASLVSTCCAYSSHGQS